jgi:hypothetical protein
MTDTTTPPPVATEREAFEALALQFVGLEPLSDFDYAGFARAAIAQESLKHCRVTEIKLTEDQRSMLTSTAKEIPGAALAPVVAPVKDERIAELWSEACAQYKPGMNTSPVHIFVRLLSQHPAVAPSASPAQGDEALRQAMEAHAANGLAWAVSRWQAEVSQRPPVNVHRRTLDDTWRQVVRYFGGDPGKLLGASHDELCARLEGTK